MQLKPIALACLAALLNAGCGGGSGNQNGQTIPTSGTVSSAYLLACVDSNHNAQCDDADTSRTVTAAGATGLSPAAGEYVLVEGRDAANQRTSLLVSAKGDAQATGLTTLRTLLNLGANSALEQALVAQQGDKLAATLQAGYAAALAAHPAGLSTLAAFSAAVRAQGTATPTGVAPATTIGSASVAANWAIPDGDTSSRQLSAQASTVMGSNESNRLYVFDPAASVVDARQVDLIPAADTVVASRRTPRNRLLAALDRIVSVFVDTASAASSVGGTPTAPVVIPPGRGIAGATLAGGGTQAVVLMNLDVGKYTGTSCASAGSEGLFRVGLAASDTTGYRLLSQSPACVHSGFTVVASDPGGARIVAWDATAKQLWAIDGQTMKETALFALQAPLAPTAMAVSPGGRYAAIAGSDDSGGGQLAIVDLQAGRVLTTLQGTWTAPGRVAFADGVRKLLVTSGATVTTFTLDNALQLAGSRSVTLAATVQDLAVAPDGASFVVATASSVSWRSLGDGSELAAAALASGFAAQRLVISGGEIVVQGIQASQGVYGVVRLPISLAQLPG